MLRLLLSRVTHFMQAGRARLIDKSEVKLTRVEERWVKKILKKADTTGRRFVSLRRENADLLAITT